MSETVSPPSGFTLAPSPASDTRDQPTPPSGFTLASDKSVADNEPHQRSYVADVGHSLGSGLVKGTGYVLGMPSDLWQMLDRGYQHLLTRGAVGMGLLTPEEGEQLRQPIPGAEDYQAGSQKINEHLMSLAKKSGADTSGPQTVPGEYAETVGSFLPGAAALGAGSMREIPKALARYGVAPALTSETAGQATKGTALEPYARVAGAILPEVALQGVGAASRAMSPMKDTLAGVSDVDMAAAQDLLDRSRAAGAPLTLPEAVQQVTGSATRLGDIQRVVEQSPKGAAVMRPFMAQRPGQTEALGQSTFGEVSPVAAEPFEVAPRVQGAADQGVSAANTARTAAVDPFYKAAATDRVPLTDMNDFLDRIDTMIASDKTGIMGPEMSKLRDSLIERPGTPGTPAQRIPATTPSGGTIWHTTPAVPPTPPVPITDIDNLDRVRKYFRDRMDLPQWSQDATSKEEIGKVGSLLNDLRGKMISASSDFAAGKNLYQGITENTFNPLVRSETGQLAKVETYPKQAQILFNSNPLPGSERGVAHAVRQVASVDPDAARQMVRMHLEKTFNEATQSNQPGANQFGGPKFAAIVSGNSQQAKNLEAAVRALPDGDTRWRALRNGLDIMQGMGTRQPVGSQTAFNAQINKWMEQGHPAVEFLTDAASPAQWPGLVKRVYQHVMYDRNTGALAKTFTEGNIADLREIAKQGRNSFGGQAALIGALARQGAETGQQQSPAQP